MIYGACRALFSRWMPRGAISLLFWRWADSAVPPVPSLLARAVRRDLMNGVNLQIVL
jgi:hypothetical protein